MVHVQRSDLSAAKKIGEVELVGDAPGCPSASEVVHVKAFDAL